MLRLCITWLLEFRPMQLRQRLCLVAAKDSCLLRLNQLFWIYLCVFALDVSLEVV